MMTPSRRTAAAAALAGALALGACTSGSTTADQSSSGRTVSVTNCGRTATFPSPARRMFVNDGGMIAMALAVGAKDQLAAVSSLQQDKAPLRQVYGEAADHLPDTGAESPTLEGVLAKRPDVMVAGYNYGYSETRNLMPQMLADRGIAPYVLSESCRQHDGQKQRGIMDPWTALRTDLTNLGTITGHETAAKAVVSDIDQRLGRLRAAPGAPHKPVVLLFDSGKDTIFTSGSFGGPQGIIDAAGATNLAADVKDTWTTISWEKVAATRPDFIAFVSYGTQAMADKVAMLEANPATRDLPAVRQHRYLDLPYSAWVSSPLNIDAAEDLRAALEKASLVPASGIRPRHDLSVRS